jgi:hypothetical protein
MNDIQKIFDEVSYILTKNTLLSELSIEHRVLIHSMLIFTDNIITHRSDVFNLVFKEALELEEAKLN